MLKIYNNLFKALNAEKVIFCNWKDNHLSAQNLLGDGDLDLYVPLRFKTKFNEISKNTGFRRVISYQANHDYIEHYYGLDQLTSKFVHIHVYYKIITGEHISKNYDLPIENFIIENLDKSYLLPKLTITGQNVIFLVRYFLKIGTLFGLLQYWRDIKKYSNEWESIECLNSFKDILDLRLSYKELEKMKQLYISTQYLNKFLFSIKLKYKFRSLRRKSYFHYQIFSFQSLIIRICNVLFLKKKKILSPGIVIGICGLDGSGKSSLVKTLQDNFSSHFCTKVFHLGRPESNIFTFFFNILIKVYGILKSLKSKNESSYSFLPSKDISLIYAFRSVLLAYDRKILSNKAHKYSKNGYIVICDRYPGMQVGKMDSPRIPKNKSKGFLYQYCYEIEQSLYKSIKKAKLIFQLSVPLEVAINRNNLRNKFGKETENELIERFSSNSNAKFLAENNYNIDASVSQTKVFKQAIVDLWYSNHWCHEYK